MKFDVVIVGPYNSENIGDFVMLFGFLILLYRKKDVINKIYILTTKNKNYLYSLLENELLFLDKKYKRILDKVEIVGYKNILRLLFPKKVWIFGGGFILLPYILNKPRKNLVILLKYFLLPLLAKIFGNKIIFYSVDGLPSFLARISGVLGNVYTRSWILYKYYGYELILDVGYLYFIELNKVLDKVLVEKKKLEHFDENDPDITKYKPREFYKMVLLKEKIYTKRYHTLLFSLLLNKNFEILHDNIINKLRLKSLVKTFKTYRKVLGSLSI